MMGKSRISRHYSLYKVELCFFHVLEYLSVGFDLELRGMDGRKKASGLGSHLQ